MDASTGAPLNYDPETNALHPYAVVRGTAYVLSGKSKTKTEQDTFLNLRFQNMEAGVELIKSHLHRGSKVVSFGNFPTSEKNAPFYKDVLELIISSIDGQGANEDRIRAQIRAEERASLEAELASKKAGQPANAK